MCVHNCAQKLLFIGIQIQPVASMVGDICKIVGNIEDDQGDQRNLIIRSGMLCVRNCIMA